MGTCQLCGAVGATYRSRLSGVSAVCATCLGAAGIAAASRRSGVTSASGLWSSTPPQPRRRPVNVTEDGYIIRCTLPGLNLF